MFNWIFYYDQTSLQRPAITKETIKINLDAAQAASSPSSSPVEIEQAINAESNQAAYSGLLFIVG